MMINGIDIELEREHREAIAEQRCRDDEAEQWQGLACSRGCRGPEPCQHVAHLAEAIKRGEVRRC
jgi:hypothetical protein